MARFIYPAIFTQEDNGQYSVRFPDIEGCYTGGEDMTDATEMAEDALCLMLYHIERDGKDIPTASDLCDIELDENESLVFINVDTETYERFYESEFIKEAADVPLS